MSGKAQRGTGQHQTANGDENPADREIKYYFAKNFTLGKHSVYGKNGPLSGKIFVTVAFSNLTKVHPEY
jgi:hypothetical protein